MPTIFKVNLTQSDKPIKQEVEKVGFPHLDADGETQYVNTHFTDEKEAWEALLKLLNAQLGLDTVELEKAMKNLQYLKDKLCKTAIKLQSAKDNCKDYLSTLPQ